MLSAAVPAAGYSFRAERLYHQSLALLENGQYEKALEGFMDVLLEDPSFPGVKEQLRKAADESVKRERLASLEERNLLMEEIRNLGAPSGREAGPSEAGAWKESMDRAISMAAEKAELEKALRAYTRAVRDVPISFKTQQLLATAKTDFQKKILALHPDLADDPKWKGKWPGSMKTGELAEAALIELYNAETWSESERDMVQQPAKPEELAKFRKMAAELDELEKNRSDTLWTAVQAFHQFKKDRFAESAKLWRRLLEADPGNAEARFYIGRIERALASAKPRKPSAYAAAAAKASAKSAAIAWPAPPSSDEEEEAEPAPKPKPAAKARQGAKAAKPKASAPDGQPPPQGRPGPGHPISWKARDSVLVPFPSRTGRDSPARRDDRAPAQVDPAVMKEWGQDLYTRGLKAYSLGKLDEAIEYWNNCLGVYPDHPKARKALERAMREKR